MSLVYQKNGNLVPGIHQLTWEEFNKEYGYNKHRSSLIVGLNQAIVHLRDVYCKTLYVDGSFVSTKTKPGDFDACWDPDGVDFNKLATKYPILIEFIPDTKRQKALYGGELFPAPKFLALFQTDKFDGSPKGIVKLNI